MKRVAAAVLVIVAASLGFVVATIVSLSFEDLGEPVAPAKGDSKGTVWSATVERDWLWWIGAPVAVACGAAAFFLLRRFFAKPS